MSLPGAVEAAWVAVLVLTVSAPRPAAAQSLARMGQELTAIEGDLRRLTHDPLEVEQMRSPTYVEERIADGELYLRLQDYQRAAIIFTDVVDHHEGHPAYPDALFLLGESLFLAGDYLGARTRYRMVIEGADRPEYRAYVQRSLGRLIEIAIHTRDFDGVEAYFERLDRLPPSELEAAAAYFRAKYLYSRAMGLADAEPGTRPAPDAVDQGELHRAIDAFGNVRAGSPYYGRARYFMGVVDTVLGNYTLALDAFRSVRALEVSSPEDQRLHDLAQLAVGRLDYETDALEEAVAAYQEVPRTSPLFERALYEIAWVYIRQGDPVRAERALEVLSVAAPNSPLLLDGKLLRGNLLIRNERFDEANRVFREIRSEFGPVLRELDAVISAHTDLTGYFRQLVRQNLRTFDVEAFLPESARRWVRPHGDFLRAVDAVEDLAQARRLVDETDDLIQRLDAALSSPNTVNVFGDLRQQREGTTSLRNRLARVRRGLIDAESRELSTDGAELRAVREQRRSIERALGRMPTSDDDFVVRNDQMLGRFRAMQASLSELEVELAGLEARIVATETFLEQTEAGGGPSTAVTDELARQRAAADAYRASVEQLKREIEAGRLSVGVGDERYARDDALRREYTALVQRERALTGGGDPMVDRMYGRIATLEAALDRRDAEIDAVVERRVAEMRVVLEEETANLKRYRSAIASTNGETENVVGAITQANFLQVRGRFYDLVVRSEVGHVDVAWARREQHRRRADELTRERRREIGALDDEFEDVMDESSAEDAR